MLPSWTPHLFRMEGGHFQGLWMCSSGSCASSGIHLRTYSPLGSHVMAASTGCITKFQWSRPLIPPFCHIMALIATSASRSVSCKWYIDDNNEEWQGKEQQNSFELAVILFVNWPFERKADPHEIDHRLEWSSKMIAAWKEFYGKSQKCRVYQRNARLRLMWLTDTRFCSGLQRQYMYRSTWNQLYPSIQWRCKYAMRKEATTCLM